ncbi:peptidase S8 [Cupriavidus sp. USMAHM13]|uniref:S8 family serine peptidase n=1 Tax=Cupriavidus sp. USMAHM13 TaxID=1389192 RepID=UPI0008A6C651|nr:S8 family serine peptidase [Cupriavidus sp. USMAHM13]AOZ02251.1 peptidase S8 [Cupriavidus sp. USMAHM13]
MLFSYTRNLSLTLLAAAALAACGGDNADSGTTSAGGTPATGGGATAPASGCAETGVDARYACQTGSTEPLYAYQWALKQATSFFRAFTGTADGVTDINVEEAHAAGFKGQGVNVLVLDDGMDIGNEDLAANVNRAMTHNFDDGGSDPTPADIAANIDEAHGTVVAGIIGAAQNGKGVMGIAPRAVLGGARFIGPAKADPLKAYGGADWSRSAHIINASYGDNPKLPLAYDTGEDASPLIRAFPKLRGGKGLVMVKAAGNEFADTGEKPTRYCASVGGQGGVVSCQNPANDTDALEPGVIVVGAANARGVRASYSSAGSVNWVTGLGGEGGEAGRYGEAGSGPTIFSTDLHGCARGYARTGVSKVNDFMVAGSVTNQKDNANCDYASMNGTSAATPTVTGVVALMLSANPNLSWRDVREILRATARPIDPGYGSRDNRNQRVNLRDSSFTGSTDASLVDGSRSARVDLGWQKNAAGYRYSNWYGFGLVDAGAAVKAARAYTAYKPAELTVPDFTEAFNEITEFRYGQVQKLGQFTVTGSDKVDALQLRLSGSVCLGSVGIFVKSPSGTVSALAVPYNAFYVTGAAAADHYGLGSYAFYGEAAAGTWEVYAVNAVPLIEGPGQCRNYTPRDGTSTVTLASPLAVEYRIIAAR